MPAATYDVFLSHAWADGERPQQIADALTKAGLRVWFDATEINDFSGITRAVTEGLAKSKALLAYYSKTYPLRRACQWELTAAFLAAQSEGDPRRRVLVINPEKKPETPDPSDHIHPIELRDAKFLTAPNGDGAALQELVQSIVKHVATLDGPLADIHPLTAPNWYGMTPVGPTRFVGRLAEMWEVHSLLHATDVAQITGAAVNVGQVSGLGGVGKSLLAEEYGLHFGAAYPGGVFWLRAYGNDDSKAVLGPQERETLRADQVRTMAERLGIITQGMTAAQIEGELKRKIGDRGEPCLWVVDDVPNGLDGEALRGWFAPHALARTLITTRSREYGSLAKGIDLTVLTPEEARLLSEYLGRHALALDVTGSALVSYGDAEPFREFRADLGREDEDILELAKDLADALPNGHEKSIAKTLLRSISGLGLEGRDFLRLASVLAVAPIPASLVKSVFERVDHITRWDAQWRQAQSFQQVTTASLGEIAGAAGDARSIHTLVSRTMRFHEKRAPERAQALRAAAIETRTTEIAKAARDARLQKEIEFQLVHARQVVPNPANILEANLVDWLGMYDLEHGAYASARRLSERGLEFRGRVKGPEHPNTLRTMGNLASILLSEGDLAGARKLDEEVLALVTRVLGPEHPDTLTSMNNLAEALRAQGDLAGARKLYEELLALFIRVAGPEHPATLGSMNNLASTLQNQGDLVGARKLLEDVLVTQRRVLGSQHLDTLTTMNNLAVVLRDEGDMVEARKLQEEVFRSRHGLLGPEHPHTLVAMGTLGVTLQQLGDLPTARDLLTEGLAISRRGLGPEHPSTLTLMNNLAVILRAQGDLAGARLLEEETLAVNRRRLGPEHPNTLISANNLAAALRAEGDLEGARRLQEETLDIQRRVLGSEHPSTLTSINNLAGTLQTQGDLEGARARFEEVLAIRRRVLGPEHPETLTSMSNLALTITAQGDLAGAHKLHEEALDIKGRVLGPEHPSTSISAWNLFRTLQDLGERAAARAVLERDLLWLLDRDPATLGADQRQIREYVTGEVKKSG